MPELFYIEEALEDINMSDVKSPEEEVSEGEEVLFILDDKSKVLYHLFSEKGVELEESAKRLRDAHNKLEEIRKIDTTSIKDLTQQRKIINEVFEEACTKKSQFKTLSEYFWSFLRLQLLNFDGTEGLGVRKGFQVVKIPKREISLFDLLCPRGVMGYGTFEEDPDQE